MCDNQKYLICFSFSVSMSPERFVTNIQAERLLISAQMENGPKSPLIGHSHTRHITCSLADSVSSDGFMMSLLVFALSLS